MSIAWKAPATLNPGLGEGLHSFTIDLRGLTIAFPRSTNGSHGFTIDVCGFANDCGCFTIDFHFQIRPDHFLIHTDHFQIPSYPVQIRADH